METPVLKRVMRIDSVPNAETYFTEEGFLRDEPIVTSTGIFEYRNNDGSIRRELRLPKHVFDKDSLMSYSGKPIIISHRAGTVDKENVMDEIVGTILSDGYRDGQNVRAKIIIHDIDKVKKIPSRELSLGYNLDLIEEEGTWNGIHYDALQTNIRVNHLAIVDTARAGEQAHLNLDGTTNELENKSDILVGGKAMAKNSTAYLTADELEEAVNAYRLRFDAAEVEESEEVAEVEETEEANTDSADAEVEVQADADDAEETEEVNTDADDTEDADETEEADVQEDVQTDADDVEEAEETPMNKDGKTPEDIINLVKEHKDRKDADMEDAETVKKVIGQQDEDIDMLIATLEKLISDLKAKNTDEADLAEDKAHDDEAEAEEVQTDADDVEEEVEAEVVDEEEPVEEETEKTDSKDCKKDCKNADSAEDIFRQKLNICRIGDKLNLDGLEELSVEDGKKEIIKNAIPSMAMRLDGQSSAYINALYDLAVNEVNAPKDVNYQKRQMVEGNTKEVRNDSKEAKVNNKTVSMADKARWTMINREGGNE